MPPEAQRRVVVTGAAGFIGRNLMLRLAERGVQAHAVTRQTPSRQAHSLLAQADVIFHLAGANRPRDPADFWRLNRDYAQSMVQAVAEGGRQPLIVAASSTQALEDHDYGRSKKAGEDALLDSGVARVAVYRLPNVFGKWARPDYNSVVATYCHNIARGLPIRIDDVQHGLSLLHIDDLIDQWLVLLDAPPAQSGIVVPGDVWRITLGDLAATIETFAQTRGKGEILEVGTGLTRRLYATYIAALPEADFSYPLRAHSDPRGSFVEVLKTPASGQISCFTAHPGVTRGGHYHHAKVEKFLVLHGQALFRFRHMLSGATHEVRTTAEDPTIVETIPGWAHDVTNEGEDMLAVLVWANECFDPARPDTVAAPL